jgi:SAM-dependent methyltransferase
MSSEPTTTSTLALAVWPTPTRRQHRYLAASSGQHPIAPELAARGILAYSDVGDLIVDPSCGIGTVLVEAIRLGRRAIGVEADRAKAALAIANISHARQQGAPGRAAVLEGNPQELPRLLPDAGSILNTPGASHVLRHPAGSVQLLLTRAPATPTDALLRSWLTVLVPGGFLLLVHDQHAGRSRPGLAGVVADCEQAGLEYWQHVIATRSNPQARDALLHIDVLAFRKPSNDATLADRHVNPRAVAA